MSVVGAFLCANLALAMCVAALWLQRVAFRPTAFEEKRNLKVVVIAATFFPVSALLLSLIWGVQVHLIHAIAIPGTFFANVTDAVSQAPVIDAFAKMIMIATAVAGSFVLARDIHRLHVLRASTELYKQHAKLQVRLGGKHHAPCSFSFFGSTTIILPAQLDPAALTCVLSHEMSHVRAHDTTWNWVIAGFRLLYGLNPAFWFWLRLYDRACEVTCDQNAVLQRNLSPRTYGLTLLEIASRQVAARSQPTIFSSFIGATRSQAADVRQRIEALVAPRTPDTSRVTHASTALAIVICLCVTSTEVSLRSWSLSTLSDATNQNLYRFSEHPRTPPYGLVLAY